MSFGFVGTAFPFHMLHELIGPEYQKENDGYFSNMGALMVVDGKPLKWSEEWVWKHRKAHIAMTRTRHHKSRLEIDSVTFAPYLSSPGEERRVLVQVLNLRNTGNKTIDNAGIVFQTYADYSDAGPSFFEQERQGKTLRVSVLEDGWSMADETMIEDSPALFGPEMMLEAGEERQILFLFEFTRDEELPGKGKEALLEMGWEKALTETIANWKTWTEAGLTVKTPDRKVDDLMENLKGTVRALQAHNGAGVEISLHTNTWHRDVYPPVRTFVKFGYPDEAWAMADYLYKAASVVGGIGNALSADHIFPDPLPEIDWMANIPFTNDRLKGEGPSFLPLMHLAAWRYTGQAERLIDRWDYLMHALRGQTVTDEGYMYFSGDETFRPQLGANLCLSALYSFVYDTYSAYSAYLFVEACEQLAEFIDKEELDKEDDRLWLLERAAFVRAKTEEHYWLSEEERYSPFIYRDSLDPETMPAEDVNTQPIWLGYLNRNDERAVKNMQSTMDEILLENGILQNQCPEAGSLLDYDITQGLMTGMSPSYFLYNLAELNHPAAAKAFDAMELYASSSGNYYEAGIHEPAGRALCVFYDRTGVIGEEWARYRLWEGAIALEALMHYLIGYKADAIEGSVNLSPRLTHDSSWIAAERIPFKDQLMSLDYREAEGGYRLTVDMEADPSSFDLHTFKIRLNVPGPAIAAVRLNDEILSVEAYELRPAYEGLNEVILEIEAKAGGFVLFVEMAEIE